MTRLQKALFHQGTKDAKRFGMKLAFLASPALAHLRGLRFKFRFFKSSCSVGTGRTCLYDNEYRDEQEVDRIEAGMGRDRVTVHVYADTP